jgi:hypothetical protein
MIRLKMKVMDDNRLEVEPTQALLAFLRVFFTFIVKFKAHFGIEPDAKVVVHDSLFLIHLTVLD